MSQTESPWTFWLALVGTLTGSASLLISYLKYRNERAKLVIEHDHNSMQGYFYTLELSGNNSSRLDRVLLRAPSAVS